MYRKTINDKHPNFRDNNGRLFLVRCFNCGRENYIPNVALGICTWCNWREEKNNEINKS